MYLPSEEVVALQWDLKENFVAQDCSTNIFVAAFTTAWARIKLYSEMDKLGRDVIYHDTDSIVYASNGENDPPLGNYLGEFTDELNGDVITTFVSGKCNFSCLFSELSMYIKCINFDYFSYFRRPKKLRLSNL